MKTVSSRFYIVLSLNLPMKLLVCLTALLSVFPLLSCSNPENELSDEMQIIPFEYREIHDTLGCRYGVYWKIDDFQDLGRRCFDADGLRAIFGIGNLEGKSDFDQIYPWKEIRRCNVRFVGDSLVTTFEGEESFSLDGSNGDVMVYIPKFYVEKYVENGYEYRVVSGKGSMPHPAFVEGDRELDAIYVSAFEGWIGEDGLLRSVADVIPTTNITAQEFLDAAQRRGSGYTLYDMRTVDMLFTLFAVEYGCRNSGVIFGHGVADYRQPIEREWDKAGLYYSCYNEQHTNSITCRRQLRSLIRPGTNVCICQGNQRNILSFARCTSMVVDGNQCTYSFDGPPIDITTDCFIGSCAQSTDWTSTCSVPYHGHSGRANVRENGFNANERNAMRYRWVENLVGNVWHYLPDVMFVGGQMYVCSNLCDYRFSYNPPPGYVPYGPSFPKNNDNGSLAEVSTIGIVAICSRPALGITSTGAGIFMARDCC